MISNVPTPPIVICDREGVDLSVHSSVDDAALSLETVDVRNERFVAFDSIGRLLKLAVLPAQGRRARGLLAGGPGEVVSIALVDAVPRHEAELRERLLPYLIASGEEMAQLRNMSLPEVLARVSKRGR